METFLVEHYHPGFDAAALKRAAAQVREAAGVGSVRYLSSTIVPTDEAFLSLLEATSAAAVRRTYRRAGISFERISATVPEEST